MRAGQTPQGLRTERRAFPLKAKKCGRTLRAVWTRLECFGWQDKILRALQGPTMCYYKFLKTSRLLYFRDRTLRFSVSSYGLASSVLPLTGSLVLASCSSRVGRTILGCNEQEGNWPFVCFFIRLGSYFSYFLHSSYYHQASLWLHNLPSHCTVFLSFPLGPLVPRAGLITTLVLSPFLNGSLSKEYLWTHHPVPKLVMLQIT